MTKIRWGRFEFQGSDGGYVFAPILNFDKDEDILLAEAEYGTKVRFQNELPIVLRSVCTGYNGETNIEVTKEFAERIENALNKEPTNEALEQSV